MTLSGFASHIRSEWVQKRTDIEVVLHELRDLIVKGKTIEARNVRCNIAVPSSIPSFGLRIKYWIGNYSPRERKLRWNRGQGVIGRVYEDKKPILADLSHLHGSTYHEVAASSDPPQMWGITESHWEVTRQMGVVLSVPIFRGDSEDVIGVLTLLMIPTRHSLPCLPRARKL